MPVRQLALGVLAMLGCGGSPAAAGGDTTGGMGNSTGPGAEATTAAQGDSTGTAASPSVACVEFLACLQERAPDLLPMAQAVYGEGAACWTGAEEDAAICDESCAVAVQQQCSAGEGGGDTGGPPSCSLDAVAPGVPSPIVSGAGEGEMPVEIGEILESHCGCHLVEDAADLVEGTPPYLGAVVFRTQDEVHATQGARTGAQWISLRTIEQQNMPPVYHCGVLDYGSLPAADYDDLAAWLRAGAPDGASWPP